MCLGLLRLLAFGGLLGFSKLRIGIFKTWVILQYLPLNSRKHSFVSFLSLSFFFWCAFFRFHFYLSIVDIQSYIGYVSGVQYRDGTFLDLTM